MFSESHRARCAGHASSPRAAALFAALALSVFPASEALAQKKGDLPVRWVDRPITLPKKTLSPEFHVGVTHYEPEGVNGLAVNAVPIDLGVSYGITDDVTVYAQPLTLLIGRVDTTVLGFSTHDTKVYYGTFRLGGKFRFFHNDLIEVGAKAEFGAVGSLDMLHLTGGVPFVLHAGHVVRFETGFYVSGYFPVDRAYALYNRDEPDGGIATIGSAIPQGTLVPAPGIPLKVSFQVADPFFLGLDTGFGLASFKWRGSSDDTTFAPLGFHAGGTIASGKKPLVDIIGNFQFPTFLFGADNEPPLTQLWELGLTADLFIGL